MSFEFKPPKGTRDFDQNLETCRQQMIDICKTTFALFGAKPIQTPIFETKQLIMEKYGEDSDKQVYELSEINQISTVNKFIQDAEGEKQSSDQIVEGVKRIMDESAKSEQYVMRYDLTVPFSRFAKTGDIQKLIRYQIGTVFRKDQPNIANGRFREFMQCDFDILGNDLDPIAANAEALDALYTLLNNLNVSGFIIKINSRSALDDLFFACGIPEDKFKTVCSSIDKLDKRDWKYVEQELISKGMDKECVELLKASILKIQAQTKNSFACKFDEIEILSDKSIAEFTRLRSYLENKLSGAWDKCFQFDISLARGLDYYTSLIFEVIKVNTSKQGGKPQEVGSIAGGGRYDNLCGAKCVGFSLGIDRLLSILQNEKNPIFVETPVYDVWVIQVGDKLTTDVEEKLFLKRQQVVKKFRQFGFKAGTELRCSTGLGNQMKIALKMAVPYVIFIGEQEYDKDKLSIKLMRSRDQIDMLSFSDVLALIKK
jgi:histidyl-tRNA synthetase